MFYRKLIKFCLILSLVGVIAASFADSADLRKEPQIEWRLSQYWPHSMEKSLWTELAEHFQLNHDLDRRSVQYEINYLRHHQDYINELTHNAKPYLYYIYSQTLRHDMPAEIALVPMVESDYDPFGVSRTGATGLWQMMPGTASGLGIKIDWWYDGRRNVIQSTSAALKHLQYLHTYFGNWLLALAAYDCGDGTVRAAIRYNKRHHRPTDFWDLPLPKETKYYVPKILALAAIIEKPNHYGLRLKNIPNRPYFDGIKMKGQIEMSRIAKLSHTSIKVVRELNPAFRRWATSPSGSYWLLLPADKANLFQRALNQTDHQHNVKWIHHVVVQGDTLGNLANQYHTTVALLERINQLKGSLIRVGQHLLIPRSYKGKVPEIKKQMGRIAEDKIPGPKRLTHTVKSKENLWTIAARYKVKPSQIRYWNNLAYHDKLKPKQQLVIWKKHKNHEHKAIIHTVRQGESLSKIADHYHIPIHKLIVWNHLQDPQYLRIGEKLKIYL